MCLNCVHNQAYKKCEDLLNPNQHIPFILDKQSNQAQIEYRNKLTISINCLRFLLRQRLVFCGHNELEKLNNQENFLELLHFLTNHNEAINNVVLKNTPNNLKLT